MNHQSVGYFLSVEEERSFTKAAQRLYLSQQALSASIAALEREVGAALFERTSPLKLTYAGERFLPYAHQLIRIHRLMEADLQDVQNRRSGRILLGIAPTRGKLLLPRILPVFHRDYPQVMVNLLEDTNEAVCRAVKNGEVDLQITQMPFFGEGLSVEPFYEEHTLLLIPKEVLSTAFPGQEEEVLHRFSETDEIGLLKDCPFLLNCSGNIIRSVADRYFEAAGIQPRIAVESRSIETLLELCFQGMGIAFYPDAFLSGEVRGRIPRSMSVLPLRRPEASYSLGFGYLDLPSVPWTVTELIRIAKETISDRRSQYDNL